MSGANESRQRVSDLARAIFLDEMQAGNHDFLLARKAPARIAGMFDQHDRIAPTNCHIIHFGAEDFDPLAGQLIFGCDGGFALDEALAVPTYKSTARICAARNAVRMRLQV